jgi:hypothetical protein
MKAAIFSFVTISESSIVASVKLARFIRDQLKLPLLSKGDRIPTDLDVLIIINGAYAFAGSECLEALGASIVSATKIVWVQQDYTIVPPKDESGAESPFRKAFRIRHEKGMAPVDYWTTCESFSKPRKAPSGHVCGPGSVYVNWNLLAYEQSVILPISDRLYQEQLLYYGSFRKDRAKYFDRYFENPSVKITISAPNKKFEKYTSANIRHIDKISMSDLPDYGLGLYIEDVKSHESNHSPANRFYEMLGAGLGIVFQPESAKQLAKAGFDVDDYVVWKDHGGFEKFFSVAEEVAESQRTSWAEAVRSQREALPTIVKRIWRSYL